MFTSKKDTGKNDHLLFQMTPKDIARFWAGTYTAKSGCKYRRSRVKNLKSSRFGFKGKLHLVSRVVYILIKGPIPRYKEICHTCDHGPKCINEKHILARSHRWNMKDMYNKGRHNADQPKGDKHWSRLHPEKVARGSKHWSRLPPEKLFRKLTEFEVHQIRIQYKKLIIKYSCKKARKVLMKRFKVSGITIERIIYKTGWKHLFKKAALS